MHELSIVMNIIQIAEQQAKAANATLIDEIELDIGTMSGIDMESIDFAWKQAVKQTMLQNAVRKVNCIDARAKCLNCNAEFAIKNYYDACPVCGAHLLDILQGTELRVKSVTVS